MVTDSLVSKVWVFLFKYMLGVVPLVFIFVVMDAFHF